MTSHRVGAGEEGVGFGAVASGPWCGDDAAEGFRAGTHRGWCDVVNRGQGAEGCLRVQPVATPDGFEECEGDHHGLFFVKQQRRQQLAPAQ